MFAEDVPFKEAYEVAKPSYRLPLDITVIRRGDQAAARARLRNPYVDLQCSDS